MVGPAFSRVGQKVAVKKPFAVNCALGHRFRRASLRIRLVPVPAFSIKAIQ